MKKELTTAILLSLVSNTFGSSGTGDLKSSAKPNIIFLLVDDLGYADVGFNGSTYYETPHIDQLSKQSLVFDNSYMYPSCSPSRTAIFTGKQSFRTGVYTVPVLEQGSDQENIFSRWTVGLKHPIYMEQLAKVGYQGIHIGKWHIVGPYPDEEMKMVYPLKEKLTQPDPGDYSWVDKHKTSAIRRYYPEGRGFLKNVGGTYRGDPAMGPGGSKSVSGGYFAPFGNPFIEPRPTDYWLTDRLTDEAIDFIDQHKEGPFFVNLHFYAVHNPLRKRTEELYKKYMDKPGDPITGQGLGNRKSAMASYATMIESVDDNIQRIIDYLDMHGLRENTVILFSSDNGYNGGNSSNNKMRGSKGYIYEGGIRIPTFISWPGKIEARRTSTAISCLDYYPTFLQLAGITDYHGIMDGNSLIPLFSGENKQLSDRSLYWQVSSQWKHGTCSVIRENNFKLIQFLADGKLELYDLINDPKEEHNLSLEKTELAKKMLAELVEWRTVNSVPLPPNSVVKFYKTDKQ